MRLASLSEGVSVHPSVHLSITLSKKSAYKVFISIYKVFKNVYKWLKVENGDVGASVVPTSTSFITKEQNYKKS